MGEEEAEHPQNSPLSAGHHFPVGSAVEVLENDAGVRFVGTVVPLPRNIDPENQGKLHVRYKALLARKGHSDRLHEFVHVSSVRPMPPPPHKAGKRFEVNDVVEAYYKDGWWEGVVTAVVDGGERLVVTFEDPPDELEFAPSRLRPLWDWADGVWTWAQRKGENVNLAFNVGEKVEVSIERDGGDCDFRGAWFPAVIVRDLGNGAYSVELKDKNGGSVEEEVEFARIRPFPPILGDGKFGVFEKVDAFFDFGWWSGLIMKKVKMNEYSVFFEHSDSTKKMDRPELRPHLEWKDGKWLIEGVSEAATPKSSKSRRKSTFSDSRVSLKKHKPQIEHANEGTERVDEDGDDVEYDRERRSKRIQDVQIPSMLPLIDDDDSRAPSSAQKLPFVKHNAIWKSIESMEVLRRMPQRPHFEPLIALKENQREGLAIGCMVTFTNVVEASCRLKFSDPKSVAEDLREMLLELETYGFQVGAVRERLMKLLKAKEEEERLVSRAKGIMEQIEVRSGRRGEIERDMRVISEHLGRLQEQLKLAEVEMEKEVEEIGRLQAGLEEDRQQVESLRADFEGVTASVCNGD
ncbi:hypothetical protein SASPL_156390 [Salvia splendens]|uniref:Agenet domain-containing protein n=1 Tax=Salvia splendens TaxID=180675 RepID=A0A8X8VWS0_SALSN|nr:DUF724 domain-containing protein 6-like [Salvia splendens]KAG6383838.1 hypothetical protein SASPL_156390 [Salvia splendens]